VCLRALAAQVFHQATEFARVLGTGLVFVILVAGAAVVHQLIGIGARTPQRIKLLAVQRLGVRQRGQCFEHPARVGWATCNIHHWQARRVTPLRTEQATGLVPFILQAAGIGGVAASGGDAAKRGAAANGQHMPGHRAQSLNPLQHRRIGARHQVKAPAAIGPAQYRALDAQRMQGRVTAQAVVDHLQHFVPGLQRQRRMPE